METQNALVIGIGYVGIRLVEKINSLGIKVFGLSRNEKSLEKLERYDAQKIFWNEKSLLNFSLVDNKINFVLSTVPPNNMGNDPVLKIFNKKLSQYKGWLGYISSTSVYGGENNEIIDENSECLPLTTRGITRLKIEREWLNFGSEIFRVAGIYGFKRSPFEKLPDKKTYVIDKENHVFNRIHIDDLVAIIIKSYTNPRPKRIINISDGNPCNQIDFYREACRISNSKMPKIYKIDEIKMSDMQKSFWLSSKYIVSSILKNEFNYDFIHPDYKSGLKSIWKNEKLNF